MRVSNGIIPSSEGPFFAGWYAMAASRRAAKRKRGAGFQGLGFRVLLNTSFQKKMSFQVYFNIRCLNIGGPFFASRYAMAAVATSCRERKRGAACALSLPLEPARFGGGARRFPASLQTKILDFRGFDSIVIIISRGEIIMCIGNSPEILSQQILVGTISVGRLGIHRHICVRNGTCGGTVIGTRMCGRCKHHNYQYQYQYQYHYHYHYHYSYHNDNHYITFAVTACIRSPFTIDHVPRQTMPYIPYTQHVPQMLVHRP